MADPPFDWRAYLPALDGFPLLPCGAGPDGKAPLDPATGRPATGWQTAAYSPSQIAALNGVVLCCGTRTGPDANGLLVFDLDGPSAIAYCREHGCDPAIRTWHIVRDTDPDRFKIAFRVPPDLWHHLAGKRKHTTAPGEQIELFFGSGQIIVLGTHRPSGGFYYWPEGCTPADIIEPPPEWWSLAIALSGEPQPVGGITLDDRPPTQLPLANDDLTRAADAINALDPSMGYDDWIRIGMALHAIDPSAGFTIWDRWSAGGTNYQGTGDLEHHWRSFKPDPRGVAAGTLFKAAKAAGWVDQARQRRQAPPSPAQASQGGQEGASGAADGPTPIHALPRRSGLLSKALDAAEASDDDTYAELMAELMVRFRMSASSIQSQLFRLLTARRAKGKAPTAGHVDIESADHLEHRLPGFIPANEQALLFAPRGAGKTIAALAISRSICTGTPLLDQGTPPTPGRVLYLATDSGCASMRTQMQELGLLDLPGFRYGDPDQRFFIRGYDASQGISAWEATIPEVLWLINFVKTHQIDLVIIDSAKACLSLTETDYTDNRAVGALLTLFQRVVCPHAAVLWLNHDGRENGHNAGAKAWSEIPVMVHRIERLEPPKQGPRESGENDVQRPRNARRWFCVKSRISLDERDFVYGLNADGDFTISDEVEVVTNCRDAILDCLDPTGASSMHRSDLFMQVKRHGYSPKSVENTLAQMCRGRSPELVRPKRGHYAVSPGLSSRLSLRGWGTYGGGNSQIPSSAMDLTSPQASPDGGNSGGTKPPTSPDGGNSGGTHSPSGAKDLPHPPPKTHPHPPTAPPSGEPASQAVDSRVDSPVRSPLERTGEPPAAPRYRPGDLVAVLIGDAETQAVVIDCPGASSDHYLVRLPDGRRLHKSEAFLLPWAGGDA